MDKDLGYFIALGEKCGLKDEELMTFAKNELSEYQNNLRDKRIADRDAAKLEEVRLRSEEAKREHELEMTRIQQEAELMRIAKEHELEMAKLSQPTATGDVKVGKSNPNAFKFNKPFNERLDTLDSWFDIYDRQSNFCGL